MKSAARCRAHCSARLGDGRASSRSDTAVRSINEISDAHVAAYAVVDPVRASRAMGLARDATVLTDYSPDGHETIADVFRTTLSRLAGAEPADEAERLGKAYMEDAYRSQLALIDAGESQRMVSALAGPPAMVRMSFDVMATDDDEAWERIAARLEDVPRAMEGYRVSLAASAAKGRVPSIRLVDVVAEQCETWAASWFTAFAEGPGASSLRTRLDRAALAAASAYGDLAEWLRRDLAGAATTTDGVGRERYGLWAAYMLGADLDVDEAYEWAVDELAGLEHEKRLECERILPGEPFGVVRDFLDRDPDGTVVGVDAYCDALQDVVDEAIDGLVDVEFEIVPELRRCVVGIPPEGTALAAYYLPPSEDLRQPGTTWFPTGGRVRFPMWEQYTTAYHEAVPGHHLQMGLTRVLPLVRSQRLGGNIAHLEGWALYAERLMDELGWFRTPAARLGFLCQQAFRAARVMIDIGLHTGRNGWDFDRAVDAAMESGGVTRAYAESEVLRYLSWPAQAPSYKLGERTWLAGRAIAMQRAGGSFDRRAWHSRALALGPLGLDRLSVELAALA